MARRVGTRKRRIMVEALIERDGSDCTWCCQTMIDLPIHPFTDCSRHMTVEHILPLVLGGSNDLSNLALACHACNAERGENLEWPEEEVAISTN